MSQRRFFTAPILGFLLTCVLALIDLTHSRSIYAVGTRILDDQLLVKDILEAKEMGVLGNSEVAFQYAVSQPITYIEILSNADVYAEINVSYQNDIVSGKVKAPTEASSSDNQEKITRKAFDVQIFIYGFNDTVLNVSPAYLLNRDTHYKGVLEPHLDRIEDEDNYINGDEQYETIKKFDDIYVNNNNSQSNHEYLDENDEQNVNEGKDQGEEDENHDDYDDNNDQIDINSINDQEDKIIEVGERQAGDQLLYETFQTSSQASPQPTDHTVVFYYIDSNFITNVLFVIYGHYTGKSVVSDDYKPPVVEYSHFSPTSMKATITDFNTTSLFVHMFVHGYRPADVNSKSYVPYLRTMSKEQQQHQQDTGHSSEMSPLERLKLLLKFQQNENPNTMDSNEVRGSPRPGNSPANNMISVSEKDTALCAQQGGSTSAATPSILINLQSFQTNAAVIYLLLLLSLVQ